MRTIALLTTCAPARLAEQLTLAGYKVHEALWADEVLQLNETEQIDVVVIMHDAEDLEIPELQGKFVTLKLNPDATATDVIWELSQLFPPAMPVQ